MQHSKEANTGQSPRDLSSYFIFSFGRILGEGDRGKTA